jgi:hypothetical protein
MTCEIAIMNRYAIALAADSATTVTYYVGRERKERYFKGANKIFQLSNHRPVGVMIFGTATLHEVPWELIMKEFRRHLGDRSFNTLDGYAVELFDFIRSHDRLFPADYQDKVFRDEAYKVGFAHVMGAQQDTAIEQASDKTAAYSDFLSKRLADISAAPLHSSFTPDDLDAALARHKTLLEADLQLLVKTFEVDTYVDRAQLAEVAIRALLNDPAAPMQSTGVVIAGFADHDYFPCYAEYSCSGILLGKFIWKQGEMRSISRDTPAYINAFAMTDMVDTFQLGVAPDVYRAGYEEWRKSLRALADEIGKQAPAGTIGDVDAVIAGVLQKHTSQWFSDAWQAHTVPLLRVVGSLPIDEMADLAETLIELQSLKEKVTKPTESVGGPIDVAVISKSDGFIWIKRKHYFEPALNPRFFQRQAGEDKQ